jgi:hypothetical protein
MLLCECGRFVPIRIFLVRNQITRDYDELVIKVGILSRFGYVFFVLIVLLCIRSCIELVKKMV